MINSNKVIFCQIAAMMFSCKSVCGVGLRDGYMEYPKDIIVSACAGQKYDWLKNGSLKRYESNVDSKRLVYFCYIPSNGSPEIYTDCSLGNVSNIVEAQMVSDFDKFIVQRLVKYLIIPSMLNCDYVIIDDVFVRTCAYEVDKKVLPEESLRKLKSLWEENGGQVIKVTYDKKRWESTLSLVTTSKGTVEYWCIGGRINPMTVDSLERKIVYQNCELGQSAGL